MRIRLLLGMATTIAIVCSQSYAGESAFDAAKKIAGKYTGKWSMYGIAGGSAVEKSSWTDILTADEPGQNSGRAFVKVTDIMTFSDGSVRTSKFEEGYFVNKDGTAGDRFYELNGSTAVFKKLSDNDWTFHAVPDKWELRFLGFDPASVISASHVTVKTTTFEGESDTSHVTRITSIQWKEATGTVRAIQFVSMKGTHTRIVE